MKSTGIVRRIDELGRIVLPMELRKVMNIEHRDGVEIYVDGDSVIIKKYQSKKCCVFCGNKENVTEFNDKPICFDCINKLKG